MSTREGVEFVTLFAPVAFLVTVAALLAFGREWTLHEITVAVAFFVAGVGFVPLAKALRR